MSEIQQKQKKSKRIRGLGGVVAKQLAPLKTNEIFLRRYSDLQMLVLLNTTDSKYAALVEFNNGDIKVDAIDSTDKKALKKKVLGWDAMLSTSTSLFLKIAMGELGLGALVGKIIRRKVKAKGIKNLIILRKIFALL